jgi:DNA-directed RNA polymerase subunit RPC12/RpoP
MPMQPMSSQRQSIMEPGNRPDPIRGGIDGTTMAVMKNYMDNGMDEDTALRKAMEWSQGMSPTRSDPDAQGNYESRMPKDYQGVQTDKAYNLDNPLNRYKVPELPEGMQLPQQHNDPYLSGLHRADANTRVPRCPHCGSGSTSLDSPGDPTEADAGKGICHACHQFFDTGKESSVRTADANTMTPRCPDCGSGSTRVDSPGDPTGEGDEPSSFCPSCNLIFDPADPKPSKKASLVLAGEVDMPNPAMQHHEPHMKWADVGGKDLMAGQTYELHSSAFSVPTEIRIMNVKPDGLDVQLIGGVGNETGQPDFKISRQEAQMEKYEFVPSASAQHSVEPDTTPGISPEQVPPLDTTDQTPDAIPHTHTESRVLDPSCQKCGSVVVDTRMESAEVTSHDCARCGEHWETQEVDPGTTSSVDLSWLNQSEDDDFFSDRHMSMMQQTGDQSRSLGDIAKRDPRLQEIGQRLDANGMAREAGKTFSPSEKRELIDEHGSARNLEDLDLSNTHYEARVDYTGLANGGNVDDDHFLLGF